jgi:hypothetical protein
MRLLLLMTIPLCKNCMHYIPPPHGPFDSSFAKCKKIGTVDVVSGKTEYSTAQSVREFACGDGMLYQPEPRMSLKRVRHAMLAFVLFLI